MKEIPKSTKVVVIGGGVAGCSAAYHLAKFGWKDTILLERDQLTSGTTWHAAGLVSQLGPTAAVTKIRKYTTDLYKELEKKIDFSAGLKLNGALSIATTKGRWQELQRQATTAPPPLPIPMLLNPQQTKKFLISGTSPNNVFVSGVKDSGPAKNFLLPAFSKSGTRLNDASK